MKKHQAIDIDYQPIRDDDYIRIRRCNTTWSLMNIIKASQDFLITFLQAEFAKYGFIHDSID